MSELRGRKLWFGCVVALAAMEMVTIAVEERSSRELMVNYVPLSLLETNAPAGPVSPRMRFDQEITSSAVARPPQSDSPAARWERFEAEFGLQKKNPHWFKGTLESAKYQVDSTLFAIQDFVEHSLNFDYPLRNLGRAETGAEPPRRTRGNTLFDAIEQARLKSEVKMDSLMGHGFVGIKLVLPIGD